MEPFHLAVGLRATRAGLFHGGAGRRAGAVPETGLVAGAVVGDDAFADDPAGPEPCVGARPERGGGDGLFVVEDLGVHEAGAVIDGAVQVPVAGTAVVAGRGVATAVHPPAATQRDRCEFLHVDVDEFTGPFTLIAAHWRPVGRSVATIEAGAAFSTQDALHRRCCDTDLERDAVRAPSSFASQPQHPSMHRPARAMR